MKNSPYIYYNYLLQIHPANQKLLVWSWKSAFCDITAFNIEQNRIVAHSPIEYVIILCKSNIKQLKFFYCLLKLLIYCEDVLQKVILQYAFYPQFCFINFVVKYDTHRRVNGLDVNWDSLQKHVRCQFRYLFKVIYFRGPNTHEKWYSSISESRGANGWVRTAYCGKRGISLVRYIPRLVPKRGLRPTPILSLIIIHRDSPAVLESDER